MQQVNYKIEIRPVKIDGGMQYAAYAPAFGSTFHGDGDTPQSALEDMLPILQETIESAVDEGIDLPADDLDEPDWNHASGRLTVRLGKDIHWRAFQCAKRTNVSLNQFIGDCIAMRVASFDRSTTYRLIYQAPPSVEYGRESHVEYNAG